MWGFVCTDCISWPPLHMQSKIQNMALFRYYWPPFTAHLGKNTTGQPEKSFTLYTCTYSAAIIRVWLWSSTHPVLHHCWKPRSLWYFMNKHWRASVTWAKPQKSKNEHNIAQKKKVEHFVFYLVQSKKQPSKTHLLNEHTGLYILT